MRLRKVFVECGPGDILIMLSLWFLSMLWLLLFSFINFQKHITRSGLDFVWNSKCRRDALVLSSHMFACRRERGVPFAAHGSNTIRPQPAFAIYGPSSVYLTLWQYHHVVSCLLFLYSFSILIIDLFHSCFNYWANSPGARPPSPLSSDYSLISYARQAGQVGKHLGGRQTVKRWSLFAW